MTGKTKWLKGDGIRIVKDNQESRGGGWGEISKCRRHLLGGDLRCKNFFWVPFSSLSPCALEAGLSLPLAQWATSEGADQYRLPQTREEGAAEARPTPSPDSSLWEF